MITATASLRSKSNSDSTKTISLSTFFQYATILNAHSLHCASVGKCMRKIMKEKSLAKLAPYGQTNKSPFLNDPPSKGCRPARIVRKKWMIVIQRMKPILGKRFTFRIRVSSYILARSRGYTTTFFLHHMTKPCHTAFYQFQILHKKDVSR